MTKPEQSQEQQPLHPNCTFVCLTEDVNNSETELLKNNINAIRKLEKTLQQKNKNEYEKTVKQ